MSKKESRKERKRVRAKDRSKYKKSVAKKHEEMRLKEERVRAKKVALKRGRVVSIYSEQVVVYYYGREVLCTLRGVLKKERSLQKNLVVVGDFVQFDKTTPGEGVIWSVEKRKSLLAKSAGHKEQLIAANLDQVLITAAVKEPAFALSYIDRAILATHRANMKPLIVLNKIDLGLSNEVAEFVAVYRKLKIPIIQTSTKTGEGLTELTKRMKNKASVFTGLSGVGKSSLLNEIMNLGLVTQEVSEKSKRGRHTTTRSKLIHLDFGGFCIDTPGIQNFGLKELTKAELDSYFAEIAKCGEGCKYFNCTHSHEPGCAVKEAVKEGRLSEIRLTSYCTLLK